MDISDHSNTNNSNYMYKKIPMNNNNPTNNNNKGGKENNLNDLNINLIEDVRENLREILKETSSV